MIQRIQTLWLLLSTACAVVFCFFPIYVGLFMNASTQAFGIRENIFLFAGTTVVALTGLVTVFLYKNRKKQKLLILLNNLFSAVVFIAQYYLIEQLKKDINIVQGDWQMAAMLPLFIIVFHIFAFLGIRKDEKLLSSADRMR
jgi:tetrahydromethanopterin S-methyltransferase subunit D